MPSVKQLAEEEALRAESEPEEDDEPGEPTPEPEPEPDPAPEPEYPPEPTDEMFATVRELNAQHQAVVRRVMGPFIAGFEECDHCGGSGLAMPEPPRRKLKPLPGARTCEVCDGEGELDTLSKRGGFDVTQCTRCSGKGWIGPGNLPADEAARQAVAAYPGNGVESGYTPPSPAPAQQTTDPRVAELRSLGFTVIDPIVR